MRDWYRELAHLCVYTAMSKSEIAQKLNRDASTVSRALRNKELIALKEELTAKRDQELQESGTERLKTLTKKSWDALEEVLDDDQAPSASRVTAAVAVLKGAGELVERTQGEQRHFHVHGVVAVPTEVPLDQWDAYIEEQGLLTDE